MAIIKQKLNKEWHLKNKMPEKTTLEQRIAWHLEHVKYCSCRDIPEKLKEEIRNGKSNSDRLVKHGFDYPYSIRGLYW